ncbi:S9 family peptidase [Propionibacteriaceae bacterium G1746]|uniref:S9 family peptidase n=1 Tax=Aestuariimicrobium sp. G57 TaxID=3418485 RepID=UPI003C1B1F2E
MSSAESIQTAEPVAPVADRRPIERSHHGDVVLDPYEWLREKSNPDVIAHLETENRYTEAMTQHLAGLRDDLFNDYKTRTLETDLSVPTWQTHTSGVTYWYYTRTIEGKEYPIWCRVPATDRDQVPDLALDSPVDGEQVLLDGNVEAEGKQFFSLGALETSPDGQLLMWATDNAGDERYDVFLRDLATGQTTALQRGVAGNVTWANDKVLLYSRVDEAWRPFQVWRHTLGTDVADDQLVFQEDDERFWTWVSVSRDRSWIVLHVGSKLTGEAWLVPAEAPDAAPRVVSPRTEGLDYDVEVSAERIWVTHNRVHADFEVAVVDLDQADLAAGAAGPLAPVDAWRPVLTPEHGTRFTDVDAYASHVVIEGRRDGLPAIWLAPSDAPADAAPLVFDEPVHEVSAQAEADWDTDRIRVDFTSMVTPPQVREVRFATGEQRVLKQTPVLDHPEHGPYRSGDYVQERVWASAVDGTRIPLSIVRHRDTPVDGTAPLVLYGYGSYEISVPARFSIQRLSLLDHGIIYAIAHIRGGGEMGRAWYEQGKLLQKVNTFTDFVAAGRWLVAEGYTSPDRMGAVGGSAGGLLMGAVANIAPDLFCAIHAAVPFVDALTTILDPDLPLTVTEWEEWGDPLHSAEVYAYMKTYTPYENIGRVAYPAILATTGLNDTRVYYVEPAKWVARLRAEAALDPARPVLMRTEMVAGHAGVTGRYEKWREAAFEMAWLIDRVTLAARR